MPSSRYVILVSNSESFIKDIGDLLGNLGLSEQDVACSAMNDIMACHLERVPSHVFLDFSDNRAGDTKLLEVLRKRFDRARIVVAGVPSNSQMVVQLVKLGVHDFVAYPLNAKEVEAVFSAASSETAGSAQPLKNDHKNTTITVLGPKGGSGVTLLTANLAVSLARQFPQKVLACDLTAQCGDIPTYLDLNPAYNIRHWLERYGQVDETYMDGLILKHPLGVHVLAGPTMDQEPLGSKHTRELQSILQALKQKYEYVFIDSGTVDPGLLQTCLTLSDIILLVGCLDIPSLKGLTNVYQKLIKLDFLPEQIRIVVNRYNAKNQMSLTAFEKNINHPIACLLPNNYPLCSESVNTGKSLSELDAKSDIVKKLTELAVSLQTQTVEPNAKEQPKPVAQSLANKMARFLVSGKDKS